MRCLILERNKLVGRKVARLFMAAGAAANTVEEPTAVAAALDGVDVLCGDVFDADLIAELVRAHPGVSGVLWTAEPLKRSLRYLLETPRIDHVLGRRDFESAPRAWEVLLVARRLAGATVTPFDAYLDWGAPRLERTVGTSADRTQAVAQVQELVLGLGVPRRIAENFGELAHELLMNALYDAPVDAAGQPKFAADRKAEISLAPSEHANLVCGTDGSQVVLQVTDPFGRLERHHVVEGLARGLAGAMDSSHGGAGLGMMVCHNAASAMFFDVERGHRTEVTALFELDQNLREFRTQARSLHWWGR